MLFPPYDDRFQYRLEALAFVREKVFIANGIPLVCMPGYKAARLQFLESIRKDV